MNVHAPIEADAKSGELVTVPAPDTALSVFSTVEGIAPYLATVRKHIDAFVPDMTTKLPLLRSVRPTQSTAPKSTMPPSPHW